MKYLDEFRDGPTAQRLADQICRTTTRRWAIMEVCGGQTHSIIRNGIDQLLQDRVELIHGPGCPVCVTPLEMIDKALAIAARPDVVFCSFGDMLRVPGSDGDLFRVKAGGGDVRVVYSPLDAVRIAEREPDREVVFFAIGFETTAPANAMAVKLARQRGITNFSALVSHVLVPPAIEAIIRAADNRVQAFLAAGHVCSVMGYWQYPSLCEQFQLPIVVTGFEPLDILIGIHRAVMQLEEGSAQVENAFDRVVSFSGNRHAQQTIAEVFELTDRAWRGIGTIAGSGWRLCDAFRAFDAEHRFEVTDVQRSESTLCKSGDVLRGVIKPHECPAFGQQCTPRTPLGATMVSSEGACAAYYDYGRQVPSESGMRVTESPRKHANFDGFQCPLPLRDYPEIVTGHGGGGKLSAELVEHLFLPAFQCAELAALGDSAVLPVNPQQRWAFSTDSYVVRPLFFPGGCIGDLAVNGTVNDLAMSGARPRFLSAGFILEEGFPLATLTHIAHVMGQAATRAGVKIVTGDTKVVGRGHGDGCYINTSGVGTVADGLSIAPQNVQPGDAIILSGTIGDHGMAVMSVREGLEFEAEITSDTAPLHDLVAAIADACPAIRALRDPTRGGVAATLHEIATAANCGIVIHERTIPVAQAVQSACEILGLDPLFVANEGKLIAVVPEPSVEATLTAMRRHPFGEHACRIGTVVEAHPKLVVARTRIGASRIVTMQIGEQLPRIC